MTDTKHTSPDAAGHNRGPATGGIGTIVLVYAVLSSLWILLSDRAVMLLFSDPNHILLANTLKGWCFVGTTAGLLYFLMRRILCPLPGAVVSPPVSLRPLLLPVGLLAAGIVGLTTNTLLHTLARVKTQEHAELHAIADLKVSQLESWLKERRLDAAYVAGSDSWAALYLAWRDGQDSVARDRLFDRLDWFRGIYGYSAVSLLSEEGEVLWSLGDGALAAQPSVRAFARRAVDQRLVGSSAFFPAADGTLQLIFTAPLAMPDKRPSPVIVFQVDPASYLFPTLQLWPLPSSSGEILLLKRDGDQVLVLNELRHRPGSAGRMQMPLDAKKTLLSTQTVQGEMGPDGLVEGLDYRGVASLGEARAIAGTDWFLVAKVDRHEIYAEAHQDVMWIVVSGLMAILAVSAGAYLLRQRQELAFAERARRLQEEKVNALQLLDSIAASSTDFIYAKDIRGRYLFCNQAALKFLEKTADEVLGRDDTTLFPSELATAIMAADRQVIDKRETITWTYDMTTQGVNHTVQATKGPLLDAAGGSLGLFGISRDITDLRRAQQAVQESESTYRSLFENMLNGFAYCRMLFEDEEPVDFEYLSVNATFEALTGLHGVVGRRVTEVIPGIRASNHELFAIYGRVAKGGAPERFETYVAPLRIWFSIAVYCPKPEHFVAVFDTITERKEAEAALRRSEQLLASAQAVAHVGSWRLKRQTGEVSWSAETYRIFGVPVGTPISLDLVFSHIHPDDRARVRAAREAAARKPPYDVEYRIVVGDSVKWLRGQGEVVIDTDGTPYIGFGAVHDITDQKLAAEERARLMEQLVQAQKMESVGRLAGGVAHDFNNMLSVILGYVDMCLTQVNDGDLRTSLMEIKKAGKRSADLTRQLLAFARKQAIAPKRLSLNETTAGMLKMLRRLIGEDIELVWSPGPDLWPVLMDASQVDQILANLCVNARDAIVGVGRIGIETANLSLGPGDERLPADCGPGDYVRLAMTDTGCGMTPEVIAHAFEPFFTTKGVGRGTGLGLATVYGIAKQNQGWVALDSEPGRGTTVAVYLPRCQGSDGTEVAGVKDTELAGHGELVLLVEDEAAILEMVASMLTSLGYAVRAAATPSEAVGLAASGLTVDLLLTDVIMPEMSGRELAGRLTALWPGLRCLYMSGYTADIIGNQGVLDKGMRFIQKPFSRRELAIQVREALAEARGEGQLTVVKQGEIH